MPMDKKRYPPNWSEIAKAVKENANWICQDCDLQCLRPGQGKHLTRGLKAKLTLTVHHQDYCPENNQPSNLIALCSRCHLKRHSCKKGNIVLGQLSINL